MDSKLPGGMKIFGQVRIYLLELATKTSKAKDEAVSQKNKLDSENEEKARQSAERKANDALLVNSNLELHKKNYVLE